MKLKNIIAYAGSIASIIGLAVIYIPKDVHSQKIENYKQEKTNGTTIGKNIVNGQQTIKNDIDNSQSYEYTEKNINHKENNSNINIKNSNQETNGNGNIQINGDRNNVQR